MNEYMPAAVRAKVERIEAAHECDGLCDGQSHPAAMVVPRGGREARIATEARADLLDEIVEWMLHLANDNVDAHRVVRAFRDATTRHSDA
jgi:hypothetical protein